MTRQELKTIFEKDGIPTAFCAFPEGQAPPLPFKCWITPYSNNFAADNRVYSKGIHVQLELYTQLCDPETEALVEDNLEAEGLYWEKSQDYLEDEKCYMTIYEMEV